MVIKADTFVVIGNNEKLWNQVELIEYLVNNQHRHIQLMILPEAICLETVGLYKLLDLFSFAQVDIFTENLLERHNRYNIVSQWINIFFNKIPQMDVEPLHTWNQKKRFMCCYHRPTASRMGIAAYLFKHHKETSHINWPDLADKNPNKFKLYEFDKLASYRTESILEVGEMLPHMPLKAFENVDLAIYDRLSFEYHVDDHTKLYCDSFVDIISEAHVLGNTFYPTEKTARTLWLKTPFVVFSTKGYLAHLRQMGFQTFGDFWSESYDDYDDKERFNRILTLIDSLAEKSINELQEIYIAMQPILENNYQLMKNQTYSTEITPLPY
jgi:hypothetical protein